MLVSATQWSESALCIHISPCSGASPSSHPSRSSQSTELSSLCYIAVSEWKMLSHVHLFATPWIVIHQVSLSMEFSRQEYWSGLPFPFPRDHPNPGIKPRSLALQADSLLSEPPGKPVLYSRFPLIIYFIHGRVHMSMLLSQFIPPSPSPSGSMSVSLCLHLYSCLGNGFIWTTFLDST